MESFKLTLLGVLIAFNIFLFPQSFDRKIVVFVEENPSFVNCDYLEVNNKNLVSNNDTTSSVESRKNYSLIYHSIIGTIIYKLIISTNFFNFCL